MRWKPHVRFGGRVGETYRVKTRQSAPARPYLHGPRIPNPSDPSKTKKTYLFGFIDDHVRHEASHNRVEAKGLHRWAVAEA
jgi:hypothetical protein